jgi:hypothetical protein
MTLDLLRERGIPLERQSFDWRKIVGKPISKLDDDAMTRVRVILINGIELEAVRFSHSFARMNREMQLPLARVRRVEQHQATTVNWLLSADHSPLETTIAYEQVAIEVTASVALNEPDPYMAQVYRFGLLEDFDHLYRYSALLDRLEGKDSNAILQCYSDVTPGRPTVMHHRHPADDLRHSYDRRCVHPLTKLNALTILSGEQQTHNYYMNVGPQFADPLARLLYAEIASVEEQHVTQYESIIDANETWLEKWVLHEATEVYNYWCCYEQEDNPRLRNLWEQFMAYELGHLRIAIDFFQRIERRDAAEILPAVLPEPIEYGSHREFVREVLRNERDLQAVGPNFVPGHLVPANAPSFAYRQMVNGRGSPSETVSAGYRWAPGTELVDAEVHAENGRVEEAEQEVLS